MYYYTTMTTSLHALLCIHAMWCMDGGDACMGFHACMHALHLHYYFFISKWHINGEVVSVIMQCLQQMILLVLSLPSIWSLRYEPGHYGPYDAPKYGENYDWNCGRHFVFSWSHDSRSCRHHRWDQPTTTDYSFKTADNPVILIQFIIFYPI
jgi:hypothetical protein